MSAGSAVEEALLAAWRGADPGPETRPRPAAGRSWRGPSVFLERGGTRGIGALLDLALAGDPERLHSGVRLRRVPSAGGRYPVEAHVVAGGRAWRYDPLGHALAAPVPIGPAAAGGSEGARDSGSEDLRGGADTVRPSTPAADAPVRPTRGAEDRCAAVSAAARDSGSGPTVIGHDGSGTRSGGSAKTTQGGMGPPGAASAPMGPLSSTGGPAGAEPAQGVRVEGGGPPGGPERAVAAPERGGVALVLSLVPQRTVWRYGRRSLPVLLLDLGHAIGALLAAAPAAGYTARAEIGRSARALAVEAGLPWCDGAVRWPDAAPEFPLAAVRLDPVSPPVALSGSSAPPVPLVLPAQRGAWVAPTQPDPRIPSAAIASDLPPPPTRTRPGPSVAPTPIASAARTPTMPSASSAPITTDPPIPTVPPTPPGPSAPPGGPEPPGGSGGVRLAVPDARDPGAAPAPEPPPDASLAEPLRMIENALTELGRGIPEPVDFAVPAERPGVSVLLDRRSAAWSEVVAAPDASGSGGGAQSPAASGRSDAPDRAAGAARERIGAERVVAARPAGVPGLGEALAPRSCGQPVVAEAAHLLLLLGTPDPDTRSALVDHVGAGIAAHEAWLAAAGEGRAVRPAGCWIDAVLTAGERRGRLIHSLAIGDIDIR